MSSVRPVWRLASPFAAHIGLVEIRSLMPSGPEAVRWWHDVGRNIALHTSLGGRRIALQAGDAVGEIWPQSCSTMVVLSWTDEDREVQAAG